MQKSWELLDVVALCSRFYNLDFTGCVSKQSLRPKSLAIKVRKSVEKEREQRKEKVFYVENPRSRFRTTSECVPEGPLTPLVKSPASSKGKIPRLDLAYFYAGAGSTMTPKRLSFQE